jgi:hypothetical protein
MAHRVQLESDFLELTQELLIFDILLLNSFNPRTINPIHIASKPTLSIFNSACPISIRALAIKSKTLFILATHFQLILQHIPHFTQHIIIKLMPNVES